MPKGLESFYSQAVSWSACEDDEAFQCATAKVPLDYDDPTGATIDLALKKLPASSGKPIGSLLVNPGGPGGSGIDYVSQADSVFSESLRAGFDIIGFDPRGVGASTPLVCLTPEQIDQAAQAAQAANQSESSEPEASTSESSEPESQDGSEQDGGAESEESVDSAADSARVGQEVAADCVKNSAVPEVIDHMDTASVARDMDVLRGISGDPRLYYLGTSYGTYLGARYAELFPGNVGRMVLDSAQDPSLSSEQLSLDQAEAREKTLRAFVEQCQKGQGCPLTGGVDAGIQQLRDFIDRANTAPVPTEYPNVSVDGTTTLDIIGNVMTDSSAWEYLSEALDKAMTHNDATDLASLGEPGLTGLAESQEEAQHFAESRANQAANRAVDCLDYPVQGDESQWDANAARIKEVAPTLGEGGAYSAAFCQGWGHHGDHEPKEIAAAGAPPILVVGITGDPATPYHWAKALAAQLESGRLLTVEGYGHGAYLRLGGDCASTAVDTYLLRGELPAEGMTCEGDAPSSGAPYSESATPSS